MKNAKCGKPWGLSEREQQEAIWLDNLKKNWLDKWILNKIAGNKSFLGDKVI